MSNQIKTVPFHGQQVSILNQHNKPYVEMRSIVENIGLDWGAQLKRIKRNHILNSTMVIMTTVAQDGKSREITCLPLSMLNGWLLGIDTNRVKPELREKLEQYQLECFDVLFEYWTTGEVKKKTKTTVDQRTPLRDAVNLLVSKKAITYSEAYSIIHQRFNVASIEDLPQDQLSHAVEYVHRVALEGEYIAKPTQHYQTIEVHAMNLHALSFHAEKIHQLFVEYQMYDALSMLGSDLGSKLCDHVRGACALARGFDKDLTKIFFKQPKLS